MLDDSFVVDLCSSLLAKPSLVALLLGCVLCTWTCINFCVEWITMWLHMIIILLSWFAQKIWKRFYVHFKWVRIEVSEYVHVIKFVKWLMVINMILKNLIKKILILDQWKFYMRSFYLVKVQNNDSVDIHNSVEVYKRFEWTSIKQENFEFKQNKIFNFFLKMTS